MKRIVVVAVSLAAVFALLLGALPVMAAKPVTGDSIPIGNGFPSGMHFNLNIHGMQSNFDWQAVLDNPELDGYYGNSIFIPQVGESIITYAISKGSTIRELEVEDPVAFGPGGNRVKVLLPYKVWYNDEEVSAGGFYVYARIR